MFKIESAMVADNLLYCFIDPQNKNEGGQH